MIGECLAAESSGPDTSDTELLHKSSVAPVHRLEVFTGMGRRCAWTAEQKGKITDNHARTIVRTHENPAADVAAICGSFGYEAFIVQRGEKIAASPAISARGKNTSYRNKSRPQVRVDRIHGPAAKIAETIEETVINMCGAASVFVGLLSGLRLNARRLSPSSDLRPL